MPGCFGHRSVTIPEPILEPILEGIDA